MALWVYLVGAFLFYTLLGLRVVKEYERGVRFTLGKFTSVMRPGLRIVFPVIQTWQRVDVRVKAIDVPDQDAITRDNVSIKVNAVLYYKVLEAKKSILEVEQFNYATSQLAQTTMRDVVGEVSLDELLSKRDAISKRIKQIVDKATDPWGIKVESVELKHVELPEQLKRTIGKEAEAEREKRAVIIKAEGEVVALKTNNPLTTSAKQRSKSTKIGIYFLYQLIQTKWFRHHRVYFMRSITCITSPSRNTNYFYIWIIFFRCSNYLSPAITSLSKIPVHQKQIIIKPLSNILYNLKRI
jgi:regulator of protease activity HflC (stomatin/prohibitin superfamily)